MALDQRGDELTYTTRRRFGSPRSRLRVRVGEPVQATALDDFLTARWALHSRWYGGTVIAPSGTPRVLFSPGVDVRIARPSRL